MGVSAAGIVFSNLNDNTLSRLTSDRTVASIPFACRYRLIDFCLSNLVNANISDISIVVNYNYRSLVEHIGSGKDWDLARRKTGIKIISPFQTLSGGENKLFNTHLQALKNIKKYIKELKEEYVVIMDSNNVLNIDLAKVIEYHHNNSALVTIVTQRTPFNFKSKTPRMMFKTHLNRINDVVLSTSYTESNPELSLDIIIVKTSYLLKIIDEADARSLISLTAFIQENFKYIDAYTYCYDSYVAIINGFYDYYKCSMELLSNSIAKKNLLNLKNFPIFTRVHNSAPTIQRPSARVINSLLADECLIEGTVINSIIFRGVHIGKGAVIENSILFHGSYIEENSMLNSIVCDKYVHISSGVKLFGSEKMPFYIQKGRKV